MEVKTIDHYVVELKDKTIDLKLVDEYGILVVVEQITRKNMGSPQHNRMTQKDAREYFDKLKKFYDEKYNREQYGSERGPGK